MHQKCNITNDLLLGVAFSYTNVYLTVDDNNIGKSNVNNFQFSMYGSYDITDRFFIAGQTSYVLGYNSNSRYDAGATGQTAKGSYFSNQWLTQAQIGYSLNLTETMLLTPMVLNNLSYYGSESYTETGAGGANLNVGTSSLWSYDIGGGVNYEWQIAIDDHKRLVPSAFIGYTVALANPAVSTTAQFTGGGAQFSTDGNAPGKSSYLANLGIMYEASSNVEIRLDYSLTVKDQFTSQAGILKGSYLF